RVEVQLDVVGQGVSGGQVFHLDQGGALRAVELHDSAPVRIGGEAVLGAFHDGGMNLPGIAGRDEAAFLVGVTGVPQVAAAPVAEPALGRQVEVEVFGDSPSGLH